MTAPTSMPKPPLEDPLNERELFASEIASVGAVHGNITITLANTRFDEPIGANPAKAHRIVAGRIVLTGVAAGAARDVVGIWRGAISGNMKLSFQAARSIG